MVKKLATKSKTKPLGQKIIAIIAGVGFALLALFHLLFAQGAAGIGIWVQAIPAILAVFTFVVAAYRVIKSLPIAKIIFFGTLPLGLVHIPITILVEDESPIFLIATTIAPAIAGIIWLINRKKATYAR